MKTILAIISIVTLSLSSYACDCIWGGDFFTMANQTDLVAKVKVIKKLKDSSDFNVKMEVEIIELFKGNETRSKITIWGDDGKECRPYIDYFQGGKVYYLSLFKYGNDYEQMNCGEMYLRLENGKVLGQKGIRKELSQIGEMKEQEFETKLKMKIK